MPVHLCDDSLYAFYTRSQVLAAQSAARGKVIKSRKGHIVRMVLFQRTGDPKPARGIPAGALKTTYRETLPDIGRVTFSLKRLTEHGTFVNW